MSVVRAAQASQSDRSARHGVPGATFSSRVAEPGIAVLTVAGEIDAANASDLVERVRDRLGGVRRLVLDCSDVTFFAVEGFSTLQRINVLCAQAGVGWILVPSESVSRVIRVCNPGGSLVPLTAGGRRPLRLVRDD